MVLGTIFSYPTRLERSYSTKTLQLERELAREEEEGEEEGEGEGTGSMNGGETVNSFPLSLPPPLSVCLSVCVSHLVPDPLSIRAVPIGCWGGEGSYGPLTGLLFLPPTHTHLHTLTHTLCSYLRVFTSCIYLSHRPAGETAAFRSI